MNENDRDLVIRRGNGASLLLADESAKAAMQAVIDGCVTDWLNSRPDDVKGRDDVYRLQQCVQLFRLQLETMKANGIMEKQRAEQVLKDARESETNVHPWPHKSAFV